MRRYSKTLGLRVFFIVIVVGIAGVTSQAVTTIDLTYAAANATINGGIWTPFDPATSTGTGVFDPFVRIQANETEKGYNTDGAVEFATKTGIWTHSLTLSDVPPVQVGGTWYREFLLDVNQNNTTGGRFLSIDTLIISLESGPALTGYPGTPGQNFGGPVVYNLDGGLDGDVSVKVDFDVFGAGSGDGDIRLLIPESSFAGTSNQFIYLYTEMGDLFASNDGFEEWGVRAGTPPTIPAPGAMLLASMGIGLVGWLRQRKSL